VYLALSTYNTQFVGLAVSTMKLVQSSGVRWSFW